MADVDKIRQLQRLLLGVTKAIQAYLYDDIATVMETICDMEDVKRYLAVVKCIAKVNQVNNIAVCVPAMRPSRRLCASSHSAE